jgi:hypothetical protein
VRLTDELFNVTKWDNWMRLYWHAYKMWDTRWDYIDTLTKCEITGWDYIDTHSKCEITEWDANLMWDNCTRL